MDVEVIWIILKNLLDGIQVLLIHIFLIEQKKFFNLYDEGYLNNFSLFVDKLDFNNIQSLSIKLPFLLIPIHLHLNSFKNS